MNANEPVAWLVKNRDSGIGYMQTDEPTRMDKVANEYLPLYTHQYERPHNTVLVPCDKLAEMQAEIERLTMLCDCMTTESNRKGNEIEALKAERTTMFGFIKSRGEVGQLIVYKASLEAQEK